MTNDWKPGANSNLEQDWFDRRDLIYVPSLRALGPGRRTLDLLREANAGMAVCVTSGSPRPRFEVRNQRNSATCTGHALAALIDILRLIGGGDGPREPVSARMLYTLGREVEETRASEGVQTLRSVVKAFWHNGVCPENDWRDDDASDADSLTVERAKAARAVTLSSYFRVRTLLNDFHAAISEAGAILVSAKIHEGWSLGRVHGAGGAIRAPDEGVGGGVHASVVLGWDAEGFLVLNSAGPDRGCWDGVPGIGHWSYLDWSRRVLDAWVLQLGASTPEAFDMCRCPQGQFGGALSIEEARAPTKIPRSHLLGHYAHLSDAHHVDVGTFPSSRLSVERTFTLLAQRNRPGAVPSEPPPKEEHLVLWIAGGIEGMEAATRNALARKAFFEKAGLYFYTVLWCQNVIDAARPVLSLLFELAIEKSSRQAQGAAETMEAVVQGIGRAVWRDLHNAASVSARRSPDMGDARHLFDRAFSGDVGPVHVVADGLGAVLLAALLADAPPAMRAALKSLVLIAPAITLARFREVVAPVMGAMEPGGSAVILSSREFEDRLVTGPYPRSILHLAAGAFEARGKDGLAAGDGGHASSAGRAAPDAAEDRAAAHPPAGQADEP